MFQVSIRTINSKSVIIARFECRKPRFQISLHQRVAVQKLDLKVAGPLLGLIAGLVQFVLRLTKLLANLCCADNRKSGGSSVGEGTPPECVCESLSGWF